MKVAASCAMVHDWRSASANNGAPASAVRAPRRCGCGHSGAIAGVCNSRRSRRTTAVEIVCCKTGINGHHGFITGTGGTPGRSVGDGFTRGTGSRRPDTTEHAGVQAPSQLPSSSHSRRSAASDRIKEICSCAPDYRRLDDGSTHIRRDDVLDRDLRVVAQRDVDRRGPRRPHTSRATARCRMQRFATERCRPCWVSSSARDQRRYCGTRADRTNDVSSSEMVRPGYRRVAGWVTRVGCRDMQPAVECQAHCRA